MARAYLESPAKRIFSKFAKVALWTFVTIYATSAHVLGGIGVHAQNVTSPDFDWDTLAPSTEIDWTSCYSGQKCARLILPLDYSTSPPNGPNVTIALRMIPATDVENYKGPILVNPGGPGNSGTGFLDTYGARLSAIVGSSFDIIGFDPRGIGASTPSASCFDTDSQRHILLNDMVSRYVNLTDGTLPDVAARRKLTGELCEERIGGEWGIGRFMDTPSVATDMLNIAQKLDQDKLQYWGFSYGTVLGQYFTTMYPGKVGRIVIDGVFDAENYRAGLWSTNLLDAEKVVDAFFSFCSQAGADKCPLYRPTPEQVRERFYSVLAQTAQSPITVPLAGVTITNKNLQELFFSSLYHPVDSFMLVANTIAAIETNNQTVIAEAVSQFAASYECQCEQPKRWQIANEAFEGVACGDGDPHPFTLDTYADYFRNLSTTSPNAAPIFGLNYLRCSVWKLQAKWKYTGPLEAAKTSHPLLIVSNKFDPVCAIRNAEVVQTRYDGARLLVQNSNGHCATISAPSLCTAKYIRAYFENGTLPDAGTVCEADELPFVGNVTDSSTLSEEDAKLLGAMKSLPTQG